MEKHALRVLEFTKVADILAGYAATAMGRGKAAALSPMDEPHALRNALQETTELVAAMAEGYSLPLGAVEDARPAAERARVGGSPLEPAVLWRVSECLLAASRVAASLTRLGGQYPALVSLGHSLPQCPELTRRIRSAIDAAGMVLDNASPELKDVRRRISTLRKRIESELRRLIENPDVRAVLQYPNPTITRDRYVLPVNAYRRHAVPGIVHGTSDSGATLYIEPMRIIEPGNELSEIIAEEEEEVQRVLWQLTRAVAEEYESVVAAADRIGEVDLVRAKAMMSAAFGMCEPAISEGRELELRDARHPLLLYLTRTDGAGMPRAEDLHPEKVVPLDLHLGQDFNILMITGPNTGGKTVVLKAVGLLCLMARAGMHVPAQKAVVPLYDTVYADIGDEQSLEQSLSTFSSHMSRIIHILKTATARSLVLLDELGAGTDPAEGSALGEAVLKRLVHVGCSSAVVTHLSRLKLFAAANPEVENASVDFDARTLRPTYHLRVGSVGSSNALEIAERLGLPAELLAYARGLLDTEAGGKYSSLLDEVQLAREEAEERRDRMAYLEDQAEQLKAEYEETLARLKAAEDRKSAELGLQMQERLQKMHEDAERLHEDLRHSGSSLVRQRVRALREGLEKCLKDISTLLAGHAIERQLARGDEVYVTKVHKWGEVERVDARRGRATVRVGSVQMDLPLEELQPWGEASG